MADEYPQDRRGTIERIDKPAHDRDIERVIGVVWSHGNRRDITIERHNGRARIVSRGTGDDVDRWWEVPDLDGFGIFAMVIDRTKVERPGIGQVMVVTLVVQRLDAGEQEQPWNLVTDLEVDDPV